MQLRRHRHIDKVRLRGARTGGGSVLPIPPFHAKIARRSLFAAGMGLALAGTTRAQEFPGRPIRVIVPFPPGGSADAAGRLVAEVLGRHLNGQVVVDNRAGAAGVIGTRAAAESRPDGTTLLLSTPSTFAILPALRGAELPFDPQRNFTPVAMVGRGPFALAVPPDSPLRNVADLVAAARARPGAINFGSAGIGTTPHLVVELLRERSGLELTHVPFRGGAPAVTALLGGQIQMVAAFVSEVAPFAADHRVHLLAVTGEQRQPDLPEVPTLREGGIDLAVYAWFGLHGPAGLPAPIVERLHQAIGAGLAEPATQQRLAAIGISPARMTTADFAGAQQRELALYGRLRGTVTLE
jgi:tripartite-type tricarboxylate transporter receptor subunit TctC